MEISPARVTALDILLTAERGGYVGEILKAELKKNEKLEKEDRAFLTRLVEGVTERRITLDQLVDHFSKTPVKKLHPVIRESLRMGAYQLIFMDHVPDYAVINEAVELVKRKKLGKLTGFVNAILHKIAAWKNSGQAEISLMEWINKTPERKYSTPDWICRRLKQAYGKEKAEMILKDQFRERPLSLRVNRTKISGADALKLLLENGFAVEAGALSKQAVRVMNAENPAELPGWKEGLFSVQDESSMLAIEAAEIKPGDRVLDLCAAPGGKSTYAAELSGNRVIARDISAEKLKKIEENAERLGLDIEVRAGDAAEFVPEFAGTADLVICDVPCSGLGVIGKKNDIKYRLDPKDPANLAKLSSEILDTAARYVKPGGKLLFSTCTILPVENGEAAAAFRERHPEYKLLQERQLLQGIDPCDGFFFSVMQKEESRKE